jgi:hypothetical protein
MQLHKVHYKYVIEANDYICLILISLHFYVYFHRTENDFIMNINIWWPFDQLIADNK